MTAIKALLILISLFLALVALVVLILRRGKL